MYYVQYLAATSTLKSYGFGRKQKEINSPKQVTFRRQIFFLILVHPVYKMSIMQEPNMLELWNKLHFEEEKRKSIYHV